MKLRKLVTKVMSMAVACVMLATTVPFLADESISVPVMLDVESDIFKTIYGTWKEDVPFTLDVNGNKTELKKDGSATDVALATGDAVKLYAGEFMLFEGSVNGIMNWGGTNTASISLSDNSFDGCTYSVACNSETGFKVVISATKSGGAAGGGWGSSSNTKGIHWDLSAVDAAGNPMKGIAVLDTSIYFDPFNDVCDLKTGVIHTIDENGSTYFYEVISEDVDGDGYTDDAELGNIYLNNLTDASGFTSSDIKDVFNYGQTPHLSARVICDNYDMYTVFEDGVVYVENEYIDFDSKYTTIKVNEIPTGIGEANTNIYENTWGTNKGEAVPITYYSARNVSSVGSEKLELKDANGKLFATVEYSANVIGNYKENYLLLGANDADSVFNLMTISTDVKVTMAEGVTDWTVTTSYSDDTVHIKAVKSASDSTNKPDVPKTPETPSVNDSYKVELPADDTAISSTDFSAILTENATKDVVIESNEKVTFTFAKGTMSAVGGMENYDFGTSVVSDFASAGTMDTNVTADNFVTRINFNYSGKLPATASIKIFVGTEYAGKTLHYSKILEDGFKHIMSAVVDAEGYIVVTQDSCSDYVLTTEKLVIEAPQTGDTSSVALWMMVAICGLGCVVCGLKSRKMA